MSDMLSIGRSALLAYSGALTTVGENVANAHTAGYVRRSADLREIAPAQGQSTGAGGSAGGGVRAAGVQRHWNQFLADTARGDGASAAREGIRHDGARQVEQALDDGAGGIGQSMTGFFNAARTLAADPASTAGQAQLRHSLSAVTTAMRRTASALDDVAAASRNQIDSALSFANGQLSELAAINRRIGVARPGSGEFAALADTRDNYLNALSESLGASAAIDAHGRATVTLGDGAGGEGGAQLLVGSDGAAELRRGDNGAIIVASNRGTTAIDTVGGRIGGWQATMAQVGVRRADIDTLAADFTGAINRWSQQGLTAAGGAAGAPLVSSTSAADITTTPALTDALPMADAAGAANGNLVALADLRQSSNLERRWDAIVSSHAQSTASARIAADASRLLADGSAARLDAAGGVDLDTEAADLVRYQQAYQAAARVIKAADDAISTILQLL